VKKVIGVTNHKTQAITRQKKISKQKSALENLEAAKPKPAPTMRNQTIMRKKTDPPMGIDMQG